jgi:hypothetical protein
VKDREISGKGGKCLKGTTGRAEMSRTPWKTHQKTVQGKYDEIVSFTAG